MRLIVDLPSFKQNYDCNDNYKVIGTFCGIITCLMKINGEDPDIVYNDLLFYKYFKFEGFFSDNDITQIYLGVKNAFELLSQ